MKSTIKIEFDYDKKEPYIEVNLVDSPDMRDRMLKSFFQQADDSTLKTKYSYKNEDDPSTRQTVISILNENNSATNLH